MTRTIIYSLVISVLCLQLDIVHSAAVALNMTVGTFCNPERGEFLCSSKHECLHSPTQVCDTVQHCTDGSDEFPGCETTCSNMTCEHGCMPYPNGGICFCPEGFERSGINHEHCVNINECEKHFGVCSQKCTDTKGSFKCSCSDGFELLANNSTCMPHDPNFKILYGVKSNVRTISVTTKRIKTIFQGMGQVVGIAFDVERGEIFWSDVQDRMETIYRSKLDGNELVKIVSSGLILPESIAYDWIAGNIYFTDSNLTHVGVCDRDGKACTVLVQETVDKPREIALHPATGTMYWTDWGSTPAITTAGMDGSNSYHLVTGNMKWPNGLAVDHGASRLYWIDAFTNLIETTDLQGNDRRAVKTDYSIKHPFSLAVFADSLYWSDWTSFQIESCNKFTGKDCQLLLPPSSVQSKDQINGIAIYHPAVQPKYRSNPCEDHSCSHLCVLTPESNPQHYRCLCPSGMKLRSNRSKTCIDDPDKPKLFMADKGSLKSLHFPYIGRSQEILSSKKIDGVTTIGSMVYNPLNDTFIFFDTSRKVISSYNRTSDKVEPIISRHLQSVRGMDIDVVAQNLYWVDAGRQTLEVMSLKTGQRAILYHQTSYNPSDVIIVPEKNALFVSLTGRRMGQILRLSMDAHNIEVLYHIGDGEPTALAYNHELDHVLWCEHLKGSIFHGGVEDDRTQFMAVGNIGDPYSIASIGNRIFWTDRYKEELYSVVINTDSLDTPMFIGEPKTADAKNDKAKVKVTVALAVKEKIRDDVRKMQDSHPCSPLAINGMGCSHICLLATRSGRATCFCPEGMELDSNGRTCSPMEFCAISQFACSDNSCISTLNKCDGFRDCPNGEDEANCTLQSSCRTTDFVCKDDLSCIPGNWKCDAEHDCEDGSDEEDCQPKSCPHSTDFKCQLGRCIPQSWRCDGVVDCPDTDNSDEDDCFFHIVDGDYDSDTASDIAGRTSSGNGSSSGLFPVAVTTRGPGRNSTVPRPREGVVVDQGKNLTIVEGDQAPAEVSSVHNPESGSYTGVIVGLVFFILIVCLIVGAIVLYQKRGGHPKILVRPYVQQWVKYVNDPVQRWRDSRREPLTSSDAYAEVYEAGGGVSTGSEYNYANPCYSELDPPRNIVMNTGEAKHEQRGGGGGDQDMGNNNETLDPFRFGTQIRDGHYVSYSQRDKLLENEFV